ncbi:hypothetical protein V6N13_028424 [Hibiscus sabdariffa]
MGGETAATRVAAIGATIVVTRGATTSATRVVVSGPQKIIRIDMKLANEHVSMLAFTSEQITSPFLLPEMVT